MSPAALRPLRSRNFALLWSAALVSNVGSWIQTVALGVYVTDRTHNPLWTGLVAAAAFLPNGLMAPLGGALADRLDRRRWLLITTLCEASVAAVLSAMAATGQDSPALAVGLAFVGGLCSAIGLPAYQAMLPDLVPKDDLLAAVSLSSAQFNLGRVVGPALAGAALVAGSYALAFGINAVSFLAVVAALVVVRLPAPHLASHGQRLVAQIKQGVTVAVGEPGCRSAIVLIGVVALLASPFIALVPAMAIVGLHQGGRHGGAAATSVLVVSQGVGAVVGALALPGIARSVGRHRQVVAALVLLPLALTAYALAPTLWWSAAALIVVGATYIGVLSGLNTVVQLRAPTWARGRVLSLFMLALGTVYPVGALAQGALANHLGIRQVTVAGAMLLLATVGVLAASRREVLRALATDEPRVRLEATSEG